MEGSVVMFDFVTAARTPHQPGGQGFWLAPDRASLLEMGVLIAGPVVGVDVSLPHRRSVYPLRVVFGLVMATEAACRTNRPR